MTTPITTASFPKALRSEVFAYTQLSYKELPQYWRELFYQTTSQMQYEELVAGDAFGLVGVKDETDGVSMMAEKQAHVTRSTHAVYAAGYVNTLEERLFNKSKLLSMQRGARLARAFARTSENVHANIFNRAFNASYTFGDGSAWMVTNHATTNGNQSNILATAADLSEASLEDLCIQVRKAVDNVGNRLDLRPACLVYAPDNIPNAFRIIESELQNDSANNAINFFKGNNRVPKHFDWPYLDDADAFFILTDIAKTDEGLVHWDAHPFKMMVDNDSDTFNEKHIGFQIYSATVGNFRAGYGTPGA